MKLSETKPLPLRINELQQRVKNLKKSFTNPTTCTHKHLNNKEYIDKTQNVKRILLPNTIDNIDSTTNYEDTNKIGTESEVMQSRRTFFKEEVVNGKLMEEQAIRIAGLVKRNAFLEARHSQKQREALIYRGDLMKTIKLYDQLMNTNNHSKNNDKLQGGFKTYCFLKLNEEEMRKKGSMKIVMKNKRVNKNELKHINSFKDYIKAKLYR